ncbi:glycosyltransferase [Agromyces tropicus]|uniref:Glycosyltransferase n=1 Tax=Agromyces tropicus TaxID=555371 RepID=A0ABN2UEI5_9MICO
MSTYLLCATPVHGHVAPTVAVAGALSARGHAVTVLTGSRFRDAVQAVGAVHRPLDGLADYDDRDLGAFLPDRDAHRGVDRFQYDLQGIFIRPVPDQARAVARLVDELRPDAILAEAGFAGVLPLLLGDPVARPPVLALGVIPLSRSSVDVAPYGLGLRPTRGALGRLRNRTLNALFQRVLFRRTQRLAVDVLASIGSAPLTDFVLDTSRRFDRFLQLSPAEFEYARSDLGDDVRFAGAVLPVLPDADPLPPWWDELDGSRPVVHVSQGTVDHLDFGRLVRPTLDALAGRDVLVVVATGGRPVHELGELPPNARAAEFLPYDRLFPRTDVFVTNAGFGGVQFALSHGVPMVAAGDTEDKPEVSMRVQVCGAGLALRSGAPRPRTIRRAVDRVLSDAVFRERAAELASRVAGYDTFGIIEEELEAAVAARRGSPRLAA